MSFERVFSFEPDFIRTSFVVRTCFVRTSFVVRTRFVRTSFANDPNWSVVRYVVRTNVRSNEVSNELLTSPGWSLVRSLVRTRITFIRTRFQREQLFGSFLQFFPTPPLGFQQTFFIHYYVRETHFPRQLFHPNTSPRENLRDHFKKENVHVWVFFNLKKNL